MKILDKKILNKLSVITVWLLFLSAPALFLGFGESQRNKAVCNKTDVVIASNTNLSFVIPDDIINLLKNKGFRITGNTIKSLPLYVIEEEIQNIPSVRNAEIFTTIDGTLYIEIEQREPYIRVIQENNESYYIDSGGNIFPLSEKFTARVIVATGNITKPQGLKKAAPLPGLTNETTDGAFNIIDSLYHLAKYICADNFLSSLTEQIYVNENDEFEIITKVGDFTIVIGDISELDVKFNKLKELFRVALPRQGWEKYETINLKYKNQIVCKKK